VQGVDFSDLGAGFQGLHTGQGHPVGIGGADARAVRFT
jgi:hypothetical protein